jgi:hypothetical protein
MSSSIQMSVSRCSSFDECEFYWVSVPIVPHNKNDALNEALKSPDERMAEVYERAYVCASARVKNVVAEYVMDHYV